MKRKFLLFLVASLVSTLSFGQLLTKTTYDFTDGTIITAGASDDGVVTLGGSYGLHGATYGLDMKVDATLSVTVPAGTTTVTFVGSVHSGLDVKGTAVTDGDLGTQTGKVTTDLSDTFEFTYEGEATTLVFTTVANSGNDLYLPSITVTTVSSVKEATYDFTDGTIITAGASDDGVVTLGGSYGLHGATYGLDMKVDATLSVTVPAGTTTVTFVGSVHSGLDVKGTAVTDGDLGTQTGKVTTDLSDTFEFTYEGEATTLVFTTVANSGNDLYLPSITVSTVVSEAVSTYDFTDGTIITAGESTDGLLVLGGNYGLHGATYGLDMKVDATLSVTVPAGTTTVTFVGSVHSGLDVKGTAVTDGDLGTQTGKVTNDLSDTFEFTYEGEMATLVFTTVANSGNDLYLPSITVTTVVESGLESLEGKTQVWDFGAADFSSDATIIQMLDADVINAWYSSDVEVGSEGNTMPETFESGVLSWTGKANADRLRTTNTDLTRYDSKSNGDYTGYLYANGTVTVTDGIPGNRYFTIELEEDDEVSVVDMGNNGDASMTFVYADDITVQNDVATAAMGTATQVDFIANQDGNYYIFDAADKLSVFRITRKNADYVTVSGSVDATDVTTDISGYGIVFTNSVTEKAWTAVVSDGAYTVDLPAGHTYDLSLSDANGVVIASPSPASLELTAATDLDITLDQVELNTVTGSISGLGDEISNLTLTFTPDESLGKIYEPEITIDTDNSTYTVVLEPNCAYAITAEGVNDYTIDPSTITITGDETKDITFTAKSTYEVTFTAEGLPDGVSSSLTYTFTNLNEDGYEYSFAAGETVALRDGTYSLSTDGIDDYPYVMALTSNLVIDGAATTKTISFEKVSEWDFDEKDLSGTSYLGLVFGGEGSVSNQAAKSHLIGKSTATITVPVTVGSKMIVSYYYTADFTIADGEQVLLNPDSPTTGTIESVEYSYTGTEDGSVVITIGDGVGSTYLTSIEVVEVIDYAATITVGTDKNYQTINDALDAIAKMDREDSEGNIQRVTVEIDPGDYEEMLVIDQDNVTFTNASTSPSIALANAGVDIDDNAVRITSYYGHGYTYYSMSSDQKWHEDVLAVNKANGYASYENKGAGVTNGSYWNATVVISAEGFEANYIIFENSFNQYISQKEHDDVVEEASGSKGARPTEVGSTAVQDKDYIERAAALSIAGGDKIILNRCRVVGHQDSFYGSQNSRVVIYKGSMMGGTDYIFGGMVAVFYKSVLALVNSDDADGNDVSYITAAQQSSGRGYLMYECTIASATPGEEMDNTQQSKPGYFGRPWQANTSEVVFYNTTINTTNATGFEGQSLIREEGWLATLSGESEGMCEYGTTEVSGTYSTARASWATVLSEVDGTVYLSDGTTELTTYAFTQGDDEWDPITDLIANDTDDTSVGSVAEELDVQIYVANSNQVVVKGLQEMTAIQVYSTQGTLVKTLNTESDVTFGMPRGYWIVRAMNASGFKTEKVVTF